MYIVTMCDLGSRGQSQLWGGGGGGGGGGFDCIKKDKEEENKRGR